MATKQLAGSASAPDGSQYVTLTDGAGNLGGGTQTVSGTVNSAQSGTWTVQPGNTANTTAWKVDGSAVTQPVSIASVPSHAVTNAGTFAVQASVATSSTGGYSFLNIPAGQATTTVKSGAGTLHSIVLNSAATATNTTTIYDNTAGSGTIVGKPAVTTATVPTSLIYDLAFATGLTIVTATANGGDMTVTYK